MAIPARAIQSGIDRQSTWKCSSPLNWIDPASGVSSIEPGGALGISDTGFAQRYVNESKEFDLPRQPK